MPTRCFIFFNAPITPETCQALQAALLQVKEKGQEAYIVFSTPGGHVQSGIALHQFIRGMPFKVIMHNIGNVDSIGAAIFLAAPMRYASPHSTFLFHGVAHGANGNLSRNQLKEALSMLEADQTRIADLIASRSKMRTEDVSALMITGETKDAIEARQLGIINNVKDFELPARAPTINITVTPTPNADGARQK